MIADVACSPNNTRGLVTSNGFLGKKAQPVVTGTTPESRKCLLSRSGRKDHKDKQSSPI